MSVDVRTTEASKKLLKEVWGNVSSRNKSRSGQEGGMRKIRKTGKKKLQCSGMTTSGLNDREKKLKERGRGFRAFKR